MCGSQQLDFIICFMKTCSRATASKRFLSTLEPSTLLLSPTPVIFHSLKASTLVSQISPIPFMGLEFCSRNCSHCWWQTLPGSSSCYPPGSGCCSLIPATFHVLQGGRWPLGTRKLLLPDMYPQPEHCCGLGVPADWLCPLDVVTIPSHFLFTSSLQFSSPF